MKPADFASLLAQMLILWPLRIERHQEATRGGNSFRRFLFANLLTDPFLVGFVKQVVPNISADDLQLALIRYLNSSPDLADWYADVLAREGIVVDWREGEPFVRAEGVAAWHHLGNDFDQDVLLAFDYAKRAGTSGFVEVDRDLSSWRTVARCVDYDLEVLWKKGLSDLHVHTGGVRIPQAVWLQLVQDPKSARSFEGLAKAYANDEMRGNGALRSLQADAAKASTLRRDLSEGVLFRPPPLEDLQPGQKQWWSWSAKALAFERTLLIAAWRKVLGSADAELGDDLDRYVALKHRFARLAKQPVFETTIGLKHFNSQYFRRLDRQDISASGRRRKGMRVPGSTFRQSHRFLMKGTGDACAYLFETRTLQKLELRIAPLQRAPDYWRFFKLWGRLKQDQLYPWLLKHGRAPPEIRFAVHFSRSREAQPKRPRGDGQRPMPHAAQRLARLDRESAELRLALSCPTRGPKLNDLARIDVAGNERDTPTSLYGLHIRLLRGESSALELLENIVETDDALSPRRRFVKSWERLHKRGLARTSPTNRRLGLTMHAGEDFADQLDGLYQIAGALWACGMHPGDGIGHGLALARDVALSRLTFPRAVSIPLGASVESLCWLYAQTPAPADPQMRLELADLKRAITVSAARLYRMPMHEVDVDTVVGAWRMKFDTAVALRSQSESDKSRALYWQTFQPGFQLACEEPVGLEGRDNLGNLVEAARQKLVDRLITDRIVVEMNPASNLRMSGAVEPSASPTVAILQLVANGLLACINTDNPGVFSSCIENEYAILMDGVRKVENEGATRDLLERVRRIGMESVYWR